MSLFALEDALLWIDNDILHVMVDKITIDGITFDAVNGIGKTRICLHTSGNKSCDTKDWPGVIALPNGLTLIGSTSETKFCEVCEKNTQVSRYGTCERCDMYAEEAEVME